MSSIDLIAAFLIGAFLIDVGYNGKTTALITLANRDKAFVKWAFALGVLVYLKSLPELGSAMSLIIFAAMLAFFMFNLDNIKSGAIDIWKRF